MREIVITSSVLIVAILCIRFLTKGRMSPILQYALWLPVAVRLMLPVPLFHSSISILNIFPESLSMDRWQLGEMTEESGIMDSNAQDGIGEGHGDVASRMENDNVTSGGMTDGSYVMDGNVTGGDETGDNVTGSVATDPGMAGENTVNGCLMDKLMDGRESFGSILTAIWIVGMVCMGAYMLCYQIKWKRYLQKNKALLYSKKKYRGKLSVYIVKGLPSPCLCGRNIYLTKEMAANEAQLAHILAHEYCHYRHLDFIWVSVRCILTVVYWFHPLVWVAAYVSKQDSELACDEAAIRLLGEKERLSYGQTLLNLIADKSQMRVGVGIASTMSGGKKGIQERIFRIARRRRYVLAVSRIAVLLVIALIVVTFSGTGQKAVWAKDTGTKTGTQKGQYQNAQAGIQSQEEMQKVSEQMDALGKMIKEEDSVSVTQKLASFNQRVERLGSRVGIVDAKNPADYWQAYAQGESMPPEDIYLLETIKDPDNSDIKVYGMYSKEFGFRGIKILVGDAINDYDEPWLMSGMSGSAENIALYERAQDGMPKTFAYKMLSENTRTSEIWNLYLCDRDDMGTIAMHVLTKDEVIAQVKERVRFEIDAAGSKINVYDEGHLAGSIAVAASPESMERIKEVIYESMAISYQLGESEGEIRLITAIGLATEQADEVWYQGLPLLSFPVECGRFGGREFRLGEVSVEAGTKCNMIQNAESIEEWIEGTGNPLALAFPNKAEGHHDVEVSYVNPCPSYTRISDGFGERINPYTQVKRMHNGIDLAAPAGSDVLAAADGVVEQTGFDTENGHYVVLFHEANGEFTYYTACQEVLVEEGESVLAGEKIATVGSSGRSSGAHLHFGRSKDGEYIEPVFVIL